MPFSFEKSALLNAAAYANSYQPLIPWSQSIGYQPNTLKYAVKNDRANLAENFLLNSYTKRLDLETHGSLEQYTTDSELIMLSLMEQRDYAGLKKVELPHSIPLRLSLGETLVKRRSISTYTGDVISIQQLATVLRAAYGITSQAVVRSNSGNEIAINLRTVASGGGLYPLTLLVLVLNVNKLPSGLYEYSSVEDALYQLNNNSIAKNIIQTFSVSDDQISFSRANYVTLIVGHPWKTMRKYGNKGLRFLFQEIGAVSQNIHLSNIALGLSSTDCGAYYENELNEVLAFDGVNQSVLHTVVSGIFN